MIAVVIPYYQRSTGLLRRALESVAAQRGPIPPLHVLVVDDASPAPALAEIEAARGLGLSVQLIEQSNAGPAAARNTGLDRVPPSTRCIAFLDSDDEWLPDHLGRAWACINAGFDFYFSDFFQLGSNIGAFTRAGRINAAAHAQIPGLPERLHRFGGDLLDQTIRGNVIGTPTVVYDFDRHREQRFRPEFTNAGEDYLFWIEIALRGAKVAFSSACEVRCGEGVNIYARSGWGTDQHMLRLHNEIKYKRLLKRSFPINRAQRSHIDANLRELRGAFARDLMHRVAHARPLSLKLLLDHLRLDPASFAALPSCLLRALRRH